MLIPTTSTKQALSNYGVQPILRPRLIPALDAYVNQLARRQRLESLEQSGYQRAKRFDPVHRGDENDDGNWQRAAASCSNSPFRLPAQPIAATVRTSCSGSSRASGRGNDSSSRRRTGSQKISGEFERGDCLLTLHGGEVVEELIERIPGGQVVKKVLHRHPRSTEDRRAPEDLRVDLYNGTQRRHVNHRTPNPFGTEEAAQLMRPNRVAPGLSLLASASKRV